MQIKLVIWDLDDTLWRGTLAEDKAVEVIEKRADIVRAFNKSGIVSSICSKNDFVAAERTLRKFNLWDEFVFPYIAFTPKGNAVRQIIDHMQLRAANVLFVDDNIHNLCEVQAQVPNIRVVDSLKPECDELLEKILDNNKHINKSRVAEYRMLQNKHDARQEKEMSNEDFLRSCDIHAVFPYLMDNLDFSVRIEELINRTNQLNYTKTRVEEGTMANAILDVVRYDTWSVFVWDKYGYSGLVGFAMVDRATASVVHLTFSCRVMHMGIEEATLRKMREKFVNLNLEALKKPLPTLMPDWIIEDGLNNAKIRTDILAKEAPSVCAEPKLRIMFDCQSGGIAHFSRWRDEIDFDNTPRLFGMKMMLSGEHKKQKFPPMLVYGPGIDYTRPRWPDAVKDLSIEFYRSCVGQFCHFIETRGCKLFVVLPPENMPAEKYRPHMDYTCERAIALNVVWREIATLYPNISLLEMSNFATAEDMSDVSHYKAGFLNKIAEYIDDWYETQLLSADNISGETRGAIERN